MLTNDEMDLMERLEAENAVTKARVAELVSHLNERIAGTKEAADSALAKQEVAGVLRTSARKAALEQTLEFVNVLFSEADPSGKAVGRE